jgi:hypothetical protein
LLRPAEKPAATINKKAENFILMDPVNEVDVAKSPWQWILVIVMNIAVLTELCIAMYLASNDPEDFTAAFMKAFFGMLVPTLVIGFFAKRRLQPVKVRV